MMETLEKTKLRLKSCPFCGDKATIQGEEMFYACCTSGNCFASLGERYDRDAMPDHIFYSRVEAAAAWNKRQKKFKWGMTNVKR